MAGCESPDAIPGNAELQEQIKDKRVGVGADHWIEMRNITGAWERTGLIFGYADDYEECTKAIDGMKRINPGREYRCTPAN